MVRLQVILGGGAFSGFPILRRFGNARDTVALSILNNSAIFRALMPSFSFSRIAAIDALAMRSVCFWRPSVAFLLQLHGEGWGRSRGLGSWRNPLFSQGGFRSSSGQSLGML